LYVYENIDFKNIMRFLWRKKRKKL
jgi:hypothetical protein